MTVTSETLKKTGSSTRPTVDSFQPRARMLLGPGPSNVHPSVTAALAKPLVGHLDPQFLAVMDDVQDMLRGVFLTDNRLTLAVSGTGSAGMEATLVNLVEPGDEVLVCVNGLFGQRMADIVERIGGVLHTIARPWGDVFALEEIAAALDRHPSTTLVTIVHAETSTGALQPLVGLADICHDRGALLVVDAVTSLAGCELRIDDWGIDACYSGTQKCLSCPPGLAPVTVGPRGLEKMKRRTTRAVSWYLDFSLIQSYWTDGRRAYHHTAPIAMNYALHQALRLVLAEGLETRWQRHGLHSSALMAGLAALGFVPFAAENQRLPMLNAVRLPEDFDEAPIRRELLDAYDIEIGGGLGELAGRVWRVGLMGESATRQSVFSLLTALEDILLRRGRSQGIGAGVEAATRSYHALSE
ncbi:MAG: alanine--glyoxylate aminotransferase family protein [Acidobacteriota bacterium]|nr:alanine--glyoxylate aminotransferase family protein [Acidobacteriota bacterium]